MYSPRPYGLSVKNGELTEQDRNYIDSVVRQFSNFMQVSNLDSLKKQYDLPSGGSFIVQNMGGVLRAIVDKKTTAKSLLDEPTTEPYIPMLFCGSIDNSKINNDKVKLKISSMTQRRLVHYNDDAELPAPQIALSRFNIKSNNQVFPEFRKYSTQYEIQRPTWYSGLMAEVMQIVGGYGKQPSKVNFKDKSFEKVQMLLPTTVVNAIQKEISGMISPGYTGKPNKEGTFQYDYKFSKTHAVGFNEDGEPWLLQVSAKGLYAMPLPVIPETTTKAFKRYITDKDDTELKMIVDKFGGMPSGESFPTDTSEFEAWLKAGVIIKLCDMSLFYENNEYAETCGWSFNTDASEGFNTCYTYDNDNLMIGLAYKLIINLETSIYTNSIATRTEIPAENAASVDAYLSKIIPLINDYDEKKSKAIRYKLRRSPELLIARSKGVFSNDEISYWDNLELDPIANSSARLLKVSDGYLMFDSKKSLIGEWLGEINNFQNYGLPPEISNPKEYLNSLYSYIYSYLKRLSNNFNYNLQFNSYAYNLRAHTAYIENRYFQPIMRFPKFDEDINDKFTYFKIQEASSDESKQKNCDTTIFGYYVGDKLKLVNYYYNFKRESKYVDYSKLDMSEIKFPVGYKNYSSGEKNLFAFKYIDENPSVISTEAIENTGNSPRGYFYTSDFDKRSYDDYHWKFSYSLEVKRGPTNESILDGQYISSLPKNDLKLVSNLEKNISFTVPYFSRNNPFLNTEKYSEFKFIMKGGRNYYEELDKKWCVDAFADPYFPTIMEYVGVGIRSDYGYSYAGDGTRFEYEKYRLSQSSWLLGESYDVNTFGSNLVGMQVFDDFDNRDEVVNYMNQNYPGAYDADAKINHFLLNYRQDTGTFKAQNPNLFRYSSPSEIDNYDYHADFSKYVRDFFNAEGIYNESDISDIPTDNFTIAPVGSANISKGIKYPNVEKCTLYGTVLDDAIEIRDLTDRDTYFSKDAYLNYTQSTFGERQYATIGLSDDVTDVVAYGTTKFRSDGDDVCFIGVINE